MPKRIGLKKFAVAVLKTDTAEALEYHKILQLAKNIKVDIKPKTAEGKLYADDALDESNSSVTGYDLSFEINQLELADQALLLGHTIKRHGLLSYSRLLVQMAQQNTVFLTRSNSCCLTKLTRLVAKTSTIKHLRLLRYLLCVNTLLAMGNK